MAWITKHKKQKTHYIYLKEYTPRKEFSGSTQKTLFSFGNLENAINTLKTWYHVYPNFVPAPILRKCQKKDILKWLNELEGFRNEIEDKEKVS